MKSADWMIQDMCIQRWTCIKKKPQIHQGQGPSAVAEKSIRSG